MNNICNFDNNFSWGNDLWEENFYNTDSSYRWDDGFRWENEADGDFCGYKKDNLEDDLKYNEPRLHFNEEVREKEGEKQEDNQENIENIQEEIENEQDEKYDEEEEYEEEYEENNYVKEEPVERPYYESSSQIPLKTIIRVLGTLVKLGLSGVEINKGQEQNTN